METGKTNSYKEPAKKILRALGLYDHAYNLYVERPSFRAMCWNAGYRIAGAGDGLPIPPTRYIHLVTTGRVVGSFLYGGKLCHESILYALRKNNYSVNNFKDILDFGCGCGRVLRYWKPYNGPAYYGTDYNPELIAWCRSNIDDLAEFSTNGLKPPLDYEDEKFDFIYAISILTHLTEDLQFAWMEELGRVLKPDGILLLTLHGESRLHQLSENDQARFQSGQMVVKHEEVAGSNVCGSYHPRQYVENVLAEAYDIVDFIEVGSRSGDQDLYLLRKPAVDRKIS